MATDVSRVAPAATGTERHHKGRKPFSSLMKRLASLKPHSTTTHSAAHAPPAHAPTTTRTSAGGSRAASCPAPSPYAYYKPPTPPSTTQSTQSTPSISSASTSPTATPSAPVRSNTSATTASSSFTATSRTPSIRSLTTTLTTIQSTAPGSLLDPYYAYNPHPSHHHNPNSPPLLFTHQFPGSPTPTLVGLHPLNYSSATAGGLLSDDASIITLASSSKRRARRHSLDTDASVRALAPSSLWGGSRESLPLSVLVGGVRDSAHFSRRSSAWVEGGRGGGESDDEEERGEGSWQAR